MDTSARSVEDRIVDGAAGRMSGVEFEKSVEKARSRDTQRLGFMLIEFWF